MQLKKPFGIQTQLVANFKEQVMKTTVIEWVGVIILGILLGVMFALGV